jgi:ribitol 2-dehydrogenase
MRAPTPRRRTAIVTRAACELGSEIARSLELRGYTTLLVQGDIDSAAATTRFAEQSSGIDAAIIVSGHYDGTTLCDSDPAGYSDLVDADILNPMYVLRAVVEAMVTAGSGDIVLIGPLVGAEPGALGAMCAATAWSFGALARALRTEIQGSGVRVAFVQAETDIRSQSRVDDTGGLSARAVAGATMLVLDQPRDSSLAEVVIRPNGGEPCG